MAVVAVAAFRGQLAVCFSGDEVAGGPFGFWVCSADVGEGLAATPALRVRVGVGCVADVSSPDVVGARVVWLFCHLGYRWVRPEPLVLAGWRSSCDCFLQ